MSIIGRMPICFLIRKRTCVVLCRNRTLQEGVGAEAAAFSAHEQLDNLIILYDSNDVTLDKMAEFTMSEDTAARYVAYGWDVVTIDGHDLSAVSSVSQPTIPAVLPSCLFAFICCIFSCRPSRVYFCTLCCGGWSMFLGCRSYRLPVSAIGVVMDPLVLRVLFGWLACLGGR